MDKSQHDDRDSSISHDSPDLYGRIRYSVKLRSMHQCCFWLQLLALGVTVTVLTWGVTGTYGPISRTACLRAEEKTQYNMSVNDLAPSYVTEHEVSLACGYNRGSGVQTNLEEENSVSTG